MFGIAFNVALLGGLAYLIYRVITRFKGTSGPLLDRLAATLWGSLTFVAGVLSAVGSTILIFSDDILGAFNMPEVQMALKDYVSPKVMGYVTLASTGLLVAARIRGALTALRGSS
jgi:hypothetical protein